VIGHPFNPPHPVPLVEAVGGERTSQETIRRAIAFYESIGKKAIHVRKEVVGHVANRLQAALYREVLHLIEQGVLDVSDADTAVCWGPGLRWGVMGPSLLFHLGGGEGGIRHLLDHIGPAMEVWWKDLGRMEHIAPELKERVIAGVAEEVGGRSIEELDQQRDEVLLGLLSLRAAVKTAGGTR
jgi:3-hydroxyacyl-CoA dehydrogenase